MGRFQTGPLRKIYGSKIVLICPEKKQASRHENEMQYQLHSTLEVTANDGSAQQWDSAINVGTNDSGDLLQYKLIFDFHHAIVTTLKEPQVLWDRRHACGRICLGNKKINFS